MMNSWISGSLQIIFAGAILGLLSFVATITYKFFRLVKKSLDWQEEAAKTLVLFNKKFEESNSNHEAIMVKLNGLDKRITDIEHPVYPINRKKRKGD